MRTLRQRMRLLGALVCLTSVVSLSAQDPPDRERGFRPELVYDVRGIDAVDIHSGNLNLAVPLATFLVGPDVSYAFVLRYSGNLWKDSEKCYGKDGSCTVKWLPQVDNGGLGWRFSLGELSGDALYPDIDFPSSTPDYGKGGGVGVGYVSGDGISHAFFETLHSPICTTAGQTDCDVKTPNVYYTRDNSYLRLWDRGDARIVEFPDGARQRFTKDATTGEWLLQYIYGASSSVNPTTGIPTTNWVRFEYLPHDPATSDIVDWRVTDSLGRSHMVWFQAGVHGAGIVDKLEVAAFNSTVPVTYQITYDNTQAPVDGSPTVVPRPYYEVNGSPTATLKLLSRIDSPGAVGGTWVFKYRPPVAAPDPFSATLVEAVLPSGGSIHWEYQEFPEWSEGGQATRAVGIKKRTLGSLASPSQQTRYVLSADKTRRTVEELVPGATGNGVLRKTVSYFSSETPSTHALPVHPTITDGTPMGRRLSSEIYACDPAPSAESCTLQRTLYVKYEMDQGPAITPSTCNWKSPCARDVNRRVVSERTVHVTDGNRFTDVNFSGFDGLGHYRATSTDGNFDSANVRTTYTAYNTNTRGFNAQTQSGSSVGTYALTSAGVRAGDFIMLNSTDSWILSTYTSSSVTEGGRSFYTEACFDPANGFLRLARRKKLDTGGSDSADLVTRYTRDAATGYPSMEEHFGGDGASIPATPAYPATLCSLSGLNHDLHSFRIDRTYQHGALATARFVDPMTGGDLGFKFVDNVIDQNTGLLKESRDVSGLPTTYSYHPTGHLQSVQPPGAAATTYTYDAGSVPRTVAIQRGSGETALRSRVEFDPFGRARRTISLLPGTPERWSTVDVAWDALGRKASSSEPYEHGVQTPVITAFQYDAFDRPTRVVAPDGSVTRFVYSGIRERKTFSFVQTGTAPSEVSVTEQYDGQGRLWKVTENSGPTSADDPFGDALTTTYGYDPADRLVSVAMPGTGGAAQSRSFVYDGRGFLQSESQPESGQPSFTYDARGNLLTKRQASIHSPFDLNYTYDPAGRVREVHARNPHYGDPQSPADPGRPEFRLMRKFAYGTGNAAGDARNGKLVSAARYNYDPMSESGLTYKVAESYVYGDAAGRRTARRTTITKGSGYGETQWSLYKTIEMAVVHDELDQQVETTYPMCWDCGAPLKGPWRDQRTTYDHGRMKTVGGFLSDVTYWPNGMWKSRLRSNGMTDQQTVDPTGMTRTGAISSNFSTTCAAPVIRFEPEGGVITSANPSVTLTVEATGTAPLSYAWREGTNLSSPVIATGDTFVASPGTTRVYTVAVTNACGTAQSAAVTVTVGACVPPDGTISAVALENREYQLSVTPSGSEPRTFAWRRPPSAVIIGFDRTLTVGPLSGGETYSVTIANECAGSPSVTRTYTIPLSGPAAGLTATKISNTHLRVQWTGNAATYEVQRRSDASGWKRIGQASGPSYDDTTVQAGKTYAYRVTVGSFISNADVATTGTFTPAVSGQPITTLGFDATLAAVNSVRAAFGWAPLTWATAVSGPHPVPEAGALIRLQHLAACRARMDEALQSLGATAPPWFHDPSPQIGTTTIKADQINEIIGRAY